MKPIAYSSEKEKKKIIATLPMYLHEFSREIWTDMESKVEH